MVHTTLRQAQYLEKASQFIDRNDVVGAMGVMFAYVQHKIIDGSLTKDIHENKISERLTNLELNQIQIGHMTPELRSERDNLRLCIEHGLTRNEIKLFKRIV